MGKGLANETYCGKCGIVHLGGEEDAVYDLNGERLHGPELQRDLGVQVNNSFKASVYGSK